MSKLTAFFLFCLFTRICFASGITITPEGIEFDNCIHVESIPTENSGHNLIKQSDPSARIQTQVVQIAGKSAVHLNLLHWTGGLRFNKFSEVLNPGLRYKVFIKTSPADAHFEILYNAEDGSKGNMPSWRSLAGLPIQTWVDWDVYLPNMSGNYSRADNIHYDISLRLYGPIDAITGKFSPQIPFDVYVHSIQRIEKESQLPNSVIESSFDYQKLWFIVPAVALLCIGFALYRLTVLFVLVMSIPPLVAMAFLIQEIADSGESLESVFLKQSKVRMERVLVGLGQISDRLEHNLQRDIKENQTQLKEELERHAASGMSLEVNEQESYFESLDDHQKTLREFFSSAKSLNPIDRFLYKKYSDTGIVINITNGKVVFTPLRNPSEYKKGAIAKMLRQMALDNVLYKSGETYWQAFDKDREKLLNLRTLFRQAMGSSEALDDFLNNPSRLVDLEMRKKDSGSANYQFWTYFYSMNDLWIGIGSLTRSLFVNYFSHEVKEYLSEIEFQGDFYVDAIGRTPSSPAKFQTQGHFHKIASFVRTTNQSTFWLDVENSHFYFAARINATSNLVLVLREDMDFYLNQLNSQKRNTILGWLGLFLLLVSISILFCWNTIHRFYLLKSGFTNLQQGDFDRGLSLPGKDQLADLGKQFNRILIQFQEKEILSRFLSKRAISQLESEVQSSKQTVSILFCTIQESYLTEKGNNFRQISNEFLDRLQSGIDPYNGYLDKFMGKAALCVFTKPEIEDTRECILSIRRSLQEWCCLYPGLKIGMGVSTGEVVVGVLGQEGRRDFSVIGSPVNLASRLSYLICEEEVSLFIDSTSYLNFKLPDKRVVSKQQLEIKGFDQKQAVYEIL